MHRRAALIASIVAMGFGAGARAADIDWRRVDQALGRPGTDQPHGDAVKLAATLHAALVLSQTPLTAPATASAPAILDLDTAAIDSALGFKGAANGGVYQFNIPRAEAISEYRVALPPSMVTALHSHMIEDSPHLFFMHFWANDDVTKLAHGLRATLDLVNVRRGS